MSIDHRPDLQRMIFRGTNKRVGRYVSVTPQNSTNRHLSYARIILDRAVRSAAFDTANRETGLTCLSGRGSVGANGRTFELNQYDSIYIPRETQVNVSTE